MASRSKAAQVVSNGVSVALKPRYVCRTCRHQLVQREAQAIRHNSSLSSRQSIRQTSSQKNEQRRQISLPSFVQRSEQPEEPEEAAEVLENVVPMEEYNEAITWEGLEHMGHQGHWKDLPADPNDDYTPWLDPTGAATPQQEQFLCLLWLSIVEYLSLLEHLTLQKLRKLARKYPLKDLPSLQGDLSSVKIKLSSTGTVSHLEDPQGILKGASREPGERKRGEVVFSAIEIEQQLQGAKFDFRDPITFAILKRFSQLTGHRVPDPVINTVIQGNKTLTTFIDLLTQTVKPKPKKFAEILLAKQEKALDFLEQERLLVEQGELDSTVATILIESEPLSQPVKRKPRFEPFGPNVMISPRRETKVDREMEIGRWKVIKKELEDRGLPVYPIPRLVPAGQTWRKEVEEEEGAL